MNNGITPYIPINSSGAIQLPQFQMKHIILIVGLMIAVTSLMMPQSANALIDWSACRTENGTTSIAPFSTFQQVNLVTPITNTSKAFMVMSATGDSQVVNGDAHLVGGRIISPTQLQFDRGGQVNSPTEISYSVIECFNDEFTVQRGMIFVPLGATTATAGIAPVSTDRSFVTVSTFLGETNPIQNTGLFRAQLLNPTTVQADRGVGGPDAFVWYEVVEFSVASGVFTHTGNIFLPPGNAVASASIASSPTNESWLYCSYNSINDGLQQNAVGCDLANSTTVQANRFAASGYSNNIHYSVINFPTSTVTVERGVNFNNPGSPDNILYSHAINLFTVTSVNKSFPYSTNTTSGTGTSYPRNKWLFTLPNTTTLQHSFYRGAGAGTSDDNNKYWQVVNFPNGSVPATPSITSADDADQTPTVTGSAFSGTGPHDNSDWKVIESGTCTSGSVVWEVIDDTSNLTSITVNAANGSFIGTLSGETELAEDTEYWACTRYEDASGNSNWSAEYRFSTNVPPTASGAEIDGGNSVVTLIPAGIKSVPGVVTVTDLDGCTDLQTIQGYFYKTSAGQSGGNNNNFRYGASCVVDAGSCTGPGDNIATYTCNFNVQYYAEPTDGASNQSADNWTFSVEPSDEEGTGAVSSDTADMGSLAAMNTNALIDFGAMALGADTGSSNQTLNIENTGNTNLDMDIEVYGSVVSDGKSMICTTGDIPAGNLKYNSAAFTYSSGGTAITSSPVEIDTDLNKSTGLASNLDIYFGYALPATGVNGSCSGTININAIPDAFED